METVWRENERGEIIIEHITPLSARLFGGFMLGLFALFFLYYLVIGLIAYTQ